MMENRVARLSARLLPLCRLPAMSRKFIPFFLFVDCYWSEVAQLHIGQAMQTPLRQFPFIEDYLQDPGSTEDPEGTEIFLDFHLKNFIS
jgi:hypothetical protein